MTAPVIARIAVADSRNVGMDGGRGRVAGDDEDEAVAGVVTEEADVLDSELESEVLVDPGSGLTVTEMTGVTDDVFAAKSLDANVVVVESEVVTAIEVIGKLIDKGSSAPDG